MGGYVLGLSRTAATEFSFFLSIPVMFAATLFDLQSSWHTPRRGRRSRLRGRLRHRFVSALIVVKAVLGFVSRNSFAAFAWYRIVFGALLLLLLR